MSGWIRVFSFVNEFKMFLYD